MYSDAHIDVTGNLIRDPELKEVGDNKVCSFIIAVNTGKRDSSAPDQPYISNLYNCSAWGDTGIYLMDKIEKGTQVQVLGDLRADAYVSQHDNAPRPNLRVTAFDVKVRARGKDWRKQNDGVRNDNSDEKAAG